MENNVTTVWCSFCGNPGERPKRFAGGYGAMMCEDCVDHYYAVFHSKEMAAKEAVPPWVAMSDDDFLEVIPQITRTADQIADFLTKWVRMARARDIRWSRIGKALGITRQAAWERFREVEIETPPMVVSQRVAHVAPAASGGEVVVLQGVEPNESRHSL